LEPVRINLVVSGLNSAIISIGACHYPRITLFLRTLFDIASVMSAIAGALGSVIGYLGAEVAEAVVFERLLWPQRFYNDFTFTTIFKMALLFPMGGPLHRAALQTLDTFQENGLYRGTRRGNSLGTAFLRDRHIVYYFRTWPEEQNVPRESRNGFWLEVLCNAKAGRRVTSALPPIDAESKAVIEQRRNRAWQILHHLVLEYHSNSKEDKSIAKRVSEVSVHLGSFVAIFCSELSAVGAALFACLYLEVYWLALFFCVPLVLKMLAVVFSVPRESLQTYQSEDPNQATAREIFEIDDLNHGFAVIEGPEPVVRQFFRHYGHPVRDNRRVGPGDRAREIGSIALVYLFVLYFPAGLLALLWMKTEAQYLWLGYQIYAILAMHVVRIAGLGGSGRTEERIARELESGREAWLVGESGNAISAKLETVEVDSVDAGKRRIRDIIHRHLALRPVELSEVPRKDVSVRTDPRDMGRV
jgi:hypothetical protein